MLRTARHAALCTLLLGVYPVIGLGQQSPIPPAPAITEKPSVINYLVEVNVGNVNQLIGLINAQLRNNVKKITVVISSTGGDAAAGFTAYNYLKGIPAEVTTFNIGNVDSAAAIMFCAGKNRYALRDTRFLLHGTAINLPGNVAVNAEGLESQLEVLKSMNHLVSHVISSTTNKKEVEVDQMIHGQVILTPDEAQKWGLIQEVRETFFDPNANLITLVPLPVVPSPGVGIATSTAPASGIQ
jgi:ATP-dependent Clp protease, protease subunit